MTAKRIGWTVGISFVLGGILLLTGCFLLTPNTLPIALFSSVSVGGYAYAPLTVWCDASTSTDPDGYIISYSWDFGDGQTGNGLTVSHTYTVPGTFTVSLHVRDNRNAVNSTDQQISVLETPTGQILRRYQWTNHDGPQYLEVLLSETLYQHYHNQLRQPFSGNYDYDDYVLDPLDDPTLKDLADELWTRAGGEYEAFLEYALTFIQSAIAYTPDPVGMEYPLYPLETLVDTAGGDCEDTTILFVSLVKARGYSALMAHVDTDSDNTPDHVLALVPVTQFFADVVSCSAGNIKGVWEIDGQLHALAETAGFSVPLGCDPWGLEISDFKHTWNL